MKYYKNGSKKKNPVSADVEGGRRRLRCRRTVASPLPHRRSFLIVVAAFGSSWVKKGDGGLGLWWWWLRV